MKLQLRNRKLLLVTALLLVAATGSILAAMQLAAVKLGSITGSVKPYTVKVTTPVELDIDTAASGDIVDVEDFGYISVSVGKLGLNFSIVLGDIPDNVIKHLRLDLQIKFAENEEPAWPPLMILAGPKDDPFIRDLCGVIDLIAQELAKLGYDVKQVDKKSCVIYASFEQTPLTFNLKSLPRCETEDPNDICYVIGLYPIWLPGGDYMVDAYARVVTWYVDKEVSINIPITLKISPPVQAS